jgi:formyl-CoA transferase
MNMNYLIANKVPKRMGNAHANLVPYQVFACSDGHLVVAAGNDNLFRGLCRALNAPELAVDPRFNTNPGRVRNRESLIEILENIFATEGVAIWNDRLQSESVPVGPINDLSQVFADPHVKERGMCVTVEHPVAGPTPLVASPIRFSETAITYENPPPLLGEHTERTLSKLLNIGEADIKALFSDGIIG